MLQRTPVSLAAPREAALPLRGPAALPRRPFPDAIPCVGGLSLAYPGFRRHPPPVIVVGMHRSGTSLVASMLAGLGVFMGAEARLPAGDESPETLAEWFSAGYAEAPEFCSVNNLLLACAGASWNWVEPFLRRRSTGPCNAAMRTLLCARSWGLFRARYFRALERSGATAWGWKDPRNSLTLPFWLALCPEARVLHVRRAPEAAAASLHRRALSWAEGSPAVSAPAARWRDRLPSGERLVRAAARRLLRLPDPPPRVDPCLDRDHCLRLAGQYIAECLRYRGLGERYMEVWYEDLLEQPEETAAALAAFSGCDADARRVREVARLVRALG